MATVLEKTIIDLLLLASNMKRVHFQTLEIVESVSLADLANIPANDPAFTAAGMTRQELVQLYGVLTANVAELEANGKALLAVVIKADAARSKPT